MKKIARLSYVTASLTIFACVAALTAYCLWSLDRGLDLSDESYYLTAAIHPDAVILWATAMHWLTSILWRLSGSLLGFRAIGMAILASSSVVLALGAMRAFERINDRLQLKLQQRLSIAACSLAVAFLYHAFVPFTPSYNLLAVSAVYLALGMIFFTANGHSSALLQLFSGMALGIAFLTKFSSGTIAWVIVCAISILYADSFRKRTLGIAIISAGMAATVAAFILSHTSFAETLSQFRLGARVYMLGANETFPQRLIRYVDETGVFLKLIAYDFTIPLALFGLYLLRPRVWIALAGLAIFGYIVISHDYLLGGMDRYEQQTAPLLVAVVLSVLTMPKKWWKNAKALGLFGTLACLPFGIAIGTFNALHTQILFSLAPWGVLIALLGFGMQASPRYEALLIGVLFIIIVTSQTVTNGLRAPYRQYRPLSEQTEAIDIPPLGTVRIDSESRDSYFKLVQMADRCGIKQRENFLGLYNIPGIALLLQATPLGTPLLQDRLSTEPVLEQLPEQDLKSAVLGIDRDTESYDSGIPKQLAGFPIGYRSCGAVVLPYRKQKVELWIKSD